MEKQECIQVGGVWTGGVCLGEGVSEQGMVPGWWIPPDPGADSPCGQTDTCENITFLQLMLWTMNIYAFFIFEMGHKSRVLKYQGVKNFTLVACQLSGISDMSQRYIWYIWYAISGMSDMTPPVPPQTTPRPPLLLPQLSATPQVFWYLHDFCACEE